MLEVKVETVHGDVLVSVVEGTRDVVRRVVRAKGLVQEVGKVLAIRRRRDGIVVGVGVVHAADAEDDLDALGLAVGDVLPQRLAVAEELGRVSILVLVGVGPAVRREVDAGILGLAGVVLRSQVDEADRGILDASVTVRPQLLVVVLALRQC